MEYYDFFIYATAASLIFSRIFFAAGDPTPGLLASFATFGVAYVARPFGAVLFGHPADKIGRKNTLVLTLLLMGSATFLIGVLPDFDTGMAIGLQMCTALVRRPPNRGTSRLDRHRPVRGPGHQQNHYAESATPFRELDGSITEQ